MSEQAPDSPSVRITETTESVTSSHDSSHGVDVRQDAVIRALREMADEDYSYDNYEKLTVIADVIECVWPGDWGRAAQLVRGRRSDERRREGLE